PSDRERPAPPIVWIRPVPDRLPTFIRTEPPGPPPLNRDPLAYDPPFARSVPFRITLPAVIVARPPPWPPAAPHPPPPPDPNCTGLSSTPYGPFDPAVPWLLANPP